MPDNIILASTFMLCIVEFLTGCFILTGCFRKSAPIIMTLIMGVMLPLSAWIYIKNPVPDCGCFGEALIISNSATFWKNIFLTAIGIWLIKYNRKALCLITPYIQWIMTVISAAYIFIIAFIGYNYQPLIDFRSYTVGSALVEEDDETSDEPEFIFVYEKDGQRVEYGIEDELPDEETGWKFIERREIYSDNNDKNASSTQNKDFKIWDEAGDEDSTQEAVKSNGEEIILFMPDLKNVSTALTWKINSLASWAEKNDIDLIGVVSGTEEEIADWRDISLASYPIYTADDTLIKEVVRGNPGVIYIKDGVIQWKSTLKSLNTDDFMSEDTSTDPMSFKHNDSMIFRNISYLYIACVALLIFLSFSPAMSRIIFSKHHAVRQKRAIED